MQQLGSMVLALLALALVGLVDSSAYDKIVTHSRIRARTHGPNVCAVQRVMGTKKKYFSTCRNWYKGTICGKKAEVLYECCPGYMALDGMKGCPAVAPIDHVYGTLGLVGATTTQRYAEISKLRDQIEGRGSFTMFAPSDDAWDQLVPSVRSALVGNVNTELVNALHFHMVDRRLLTKDLKDNLSVKSMFRDQGLFINHYSSGVVTVNCARIIHGNQVSTNGVVHVIDRVITAVASTIKDTLETNRQLSSFNDAVQASGLTDKLDQPGHFTVFAPTNAAFDKLAPGYLRRIMTDKAVISALVDYHVLTSVQCSEAIMAGTAYETLEGSYIQVGCDGDSLTVNGIKMVLKKDIVTTNGVIHLIDRVLVPNSAKEVMELMGETQTKFRDMVTELDLASALGAKTEYTLLAPVNSAFTTEVTSTQKNLLRYILENHILKFKVTLSELYSGQMLETLAGKLLRVFIYRTAVCIENACMLQGSKEGSNGALHLMTSIIRPADKNIYQLLVADGRFKIFLGLMETAGLTDLLRQEGSYTIFAPTDDAFSGVSREELSVLKNDVNGLRTILLYHLSNGVFINGGLEGGVTNLLKTLQGSNLQVLSVNNSIHVNNVDVAKSDLMATNGVIHVVKNVLYPVDLPVGRQDLMVLLRKLIRYIQIKYVSGYTYREIPLTFLRRTITTTQYTESGTGVKWADGEHTVTRVIKEEPFVTTKVIEGQPTITKVTRVIETEPTVTRVVVGEPTITKVTRVIETEPTVTRVVVGGEPTITKVTRVIETEPTITKVVVGGEPSITKVTRVIETEPTITKVVVGGEPSITKVTRVIETEPTITKVVVGGEPSITKVTRVISGEPSITKVTRVIEGQQIGADGKWVTGGTRDSLVNEPHIIRVPDFSKITTIHGNPRLIDEESERITQLIKDGGKFAAARKAPAGMRRRARLVRRHHKPRPSTH